jgi:hypothetical protein
MAAALLRFLLLALLFFNSRIFLSSLKAFKLQLDLWKNIRKRGTNGPGIGLPFYPDHPIKCICENCSPEDLEEKLKEILENRLKEHAKVVEHFAVKTLRDFTVCALALYFLIQQIFFI